MSHPLSALSGARSAIAAASAPASAASTSTSGSTSTGKTTSDAAANPTPGGAMGKDQFLKLLVAQMKNQDPLNPMDGTQMASQLAQFSTVEQLQSANDTLTQIATAVRTANATGTTSGSSTSGSSTSGSTTSGSSTSGSTTSGTTTTGATTSA